MRFCSTSAAGTSMYEAEIGKDFEHGTGEYGNLFVISGHRPIDYVEFVGLRIETEKLAYLGTIRLFAGFGFLPKYD